MTGGHGVTMRRGTMNGRWSATCSEPVFSRRSGQQSILAGALHSARGNSVYIVQGAIHG